MKKTIFSLLGLLLTVSVLQAQQNWDVCVQTKTVLKKVEENTTGNVVTIKKSLLSKSKLLTIKFNNPDTENNITFEATDNQRTGLQSWEYNGKPFVLNGADLKKLFAGRTKIQIYYMAIPKDPAKAAIVRLRPIHLCTIELK